MAKTTGLGIVSYRICNAYIHTDICIFLSSFCLCLSVFLCVCMCICMYTCIRVEGWITWITHTGSVRHDNSQVCIRALMSVPCDFIWATSFSSSSDFYFEFVCMVYLCFGGTECSSIVHVETVSYLFNSSLLYVLRYGLFLNLECAVSARMADEWVVRLPSPWIASRLQIHTIMPGFYMGTGNSELWSLPVDSKRFTHWTISLLNSGLLFSLS